MRIVIDLQAAQSESRLRGIGRYSLALAQAIAKNAGKHDIWLALNSCFPDTIESLRFSFKDLIPEQQIKIFHTNRPSAEYYLENIRNSNISKKLRSSFIHNLSPDIIHISSLFEGLIDNAVSSISFTDHFPLTSVTLYDLIPLIFSKDYLQNSNISQYYYKKLQDLKKANLLLAISSSAKQEAIDLLSIDSDRIINCSAGVCQQFKPIKISEKDRSDIKKSYGINKKFILYVGDFDHRKNIHGLIEAFSLLTGDLREKYQLVIVGNANDDIRKNIFLIANRFFLKKNEIIITGYIKDTQLSILYNLCHLFILPSLREGLGLPLLEAMACEAVVIASNTSSIPEIIDCKDALFDPTKPNQIAKKMKEGLTNEAFRNFIKEHGKIQSKKFTWDITAKKVLESYETLEKNNKKRYFKESYFPSVKIKMAFVSPLPPDKTGIANYSLKLLPELARFYDIVIIVEKVSIFNDWPIANFTIQDSDWFIQHASSFDIILYQLGNSYFNYYMFKLLELFPGIVVLHDFFFSDVLHFASNINVEERFIFLRALYYSHGHSALLYNKEKGNKAAIKLFPCNFQVLEKATGIIVHSQTAVDLLQKWYKTNNPIFIQKIPQLFLNYQKKDRKSAREKLGFSDNDFLVCSFGFITPSKLIHRICLSLKNSQLFNKSNFHLVFVGEILVHNYGVKLVKIIKKNQLYQKISITHFVSSELFANYLSAADLAIQLRTHSRGETSSCIINCLAAGIPTIVNNHGSSREFPNEVLYKLNENFTDIELERAIIHLYNNYELRNQISHKAINYIKKYHHPTNVGEKYTEIIQYFFKNNPNFLEKKLIKNLAKNDFLKIVDDSIMVATASNIAANRLSIGLSQLLIDITTLVNIDLKSGIQRVVRGILISLLNSPPEGFRIEPIYLSNKTHYRYARNYVAQILEIEKQIFEDSIVEVNSEDIFLGLDLCIDAIPLSKPILQNWRVLGIKFYFIVYDLLPVLCPDFFFHYMENNFLSWVKITAEIADGMICISKQVAEEYLTFFKNSNSRLTELKLGFFHLGSNIEATLPSSGNLDKNLLKKISSRQSFLSVGTIEPRKGYWQLINAFTQLWLKNYDLNLIIVGKQGWMVEKIIYGILKHPEYGKRLIWLKDASDELLREIYLHTTALILASEGEGFGLPIIESAQYNLNIIVRDIPVFREVAGKNAFYFKGLKASDLAKAIEDWLGLYAKGNIPKTQNMKWLTWEESTQMLLDVIFQNRWLKEVGKFSSRLDFERNFL